MAVRKFNSSKILLIYCFIFFNIITNAQNTGVIFSEPSGVKTEPFNLSLTTEDDNRIIYYTLNGSEPDQNSTRYAQPIQITQTTMVSAISYLNGVADEYFSKVGFIYLSNDMSQFSSNLPLLIVENFNQGAIPAPSSTGFGMPVEGGELTPKQFVVSALYEPINGRTTFNSTPTITTNAGIKVRGSSSASFPKKSFGFDSWDKHSEEVNIRPMGMANDADWVLYGSQAQDPTYIRPIWMYELSRQIGQWAPASRVIEIFLNTTGGAISQDDFLGLYFFMEKIGRDKDKVDIEKLDASIQADDSRISGGYIIKVDRLDAEAEGFECIHNAVMQGGWGGGMRISTTNYYTPKERNMPDYQKPWIRNYISEFEDALREIPNSRRYTDFFDVDAAITHWILKAMPRDADAFALSEFMNKSRDGKIKMGPIWDFDRSAGSVDDRTTDYNNWDDGLLANYMTYGWYGYLHQDPEYFQSLKDKWFILREYELSAQNTDRIIDSLASEMQEAMTRDMELWPITRFDQTFQGEINHLKTWIKNRCDWIDNQWERPPVFYNNGNVLSGNTFTINPGYNITIQPHPNFNGTIYYTTDGTDPRLEGGGINPNASIYNSPISIINVQQIKARVYNNNTWSAIRQATFYINQDLSKLKITELHYNPQDYGTIDGQLLEFVELKNTGNQTLYLGGVNFSEGIYFTFPLSVTLAPGEFILVAKDPTSFELYYGFTVEYTYSGSLSNGGELIILSEPTGNIITQVEYDDVYPWPTSPDGNGFSLVTININPTGSQNHFSHWRASAQYGGSPRRDDVFVESPPILISEVRSNSFYPDVDAIEVYNPNSNSVDIGGWLLSNNSALNNAWTIPLGTSIPANGYLTFYQGHYVGVNMQFANNEFGGSFSIDRKGSFVYIFAADGGIASGYSHGIELEATHPNVSYGLYVNSVEEQHIVALSSATLGNPNSSPMVGPVVITEIMYNPINQDNVVGTEFLKIKNISDTTVALYDENNPNNTWRINGLSFYFPQNIVIEPDETIYLKNNDISDTEFRSRYGLMQTDKLFVYSGALDNSGETITILKPLAPESLNGEIIIPYAVVDRVKYENTLPWPEANGNGMKLKKINNNQYGNDPINWLAIEDSGVEPELFTLIVENGTGSGQVYSFSQVQIEANEAPEGQMFYRWTGEDESLFSNPNSRISTFTMPERDVRISAEYIDMMLEQIIISGDEWRYHNYGINLQTIWRGLNYNDNNWQTGRTLIGEANNVDTRIGIGSNNNRYPTIYFRKQVMIENTSTIEQALLQLKYNDGAVVYVNGVEALRTNMPVGNITYNTWATSVNNGTTFEDYAIDPTLFIEGENVVSVEIHNVNAASSDLFFDLTLTLSRGVTPGIAAKQFVNLRNGWNLVSLGLIPNNGNISDLFPNASIVKTDDKYYSINQQDYLNSLQTVNVGDAFLVFNNRNEQIEIQGNTFTGTFIYNIREGWNIIGNPRLYEYSVNTMPQEFELIKDFDEFYDFTNQEGALENIRVGKAYYLFSNNNTILYYSSE
jgi:hypothetical protein